MLELDTCIFWGRRSKNMYLPAVNIPLSMPICVRITLIHIKYFVCISLINLSCPIFLGKGMRLTVIVGPLTPYILVGILYFIFFLSSLRGSLLLNAWLIVFRCMKCMLLVPCSLNDHVLWLILIGLVIFLNVKFWVHGSILCLIWFNSGVCFDN
jgi:hypothetical protein